MPGSWPSCGSDEVNLADTVNLFSSASFFPFICSQSVSCLPACHYLGQWFCPRVWIRSYGGDAFLSARMCLMPSSCVWYSAKGASATLVFVIILRMLTCLCVYGCRLLSHSLGRRGLLAWVISPRDGGSGFGTDDIALDNLVFCDGFTVSHLPAPRSSDGRVSVSVMVVQWR